MVLPQAPSMPSPSPGLISPVVARINKPPIASSSKPSSSNNVSGIVPQRKASITLDPRTHKSDGINIHEGDKTKEKYLQMLYDALASDSDARQSPSLPFSSR